MLYFGRFAFRFIYTTFFIRLSEIFTIIYTIQGFMVEVVWLWVILGVVVWCCVASWVAVAGGGKGMDIGGGEVPFRLFCLFCLKVSEVLLIFACVFL